MTTRVPYVLLERPLDVDDFFTPARTDRQAIDAAIATLPADGSECHVRLKNIGRPWVLGAGYIVVGNRRLTWIVDDGATVSPITEWQKLNAPMVRSRQISMPGFGNFEDATAFTVIAGGGGANFGRPQISGYADTAEQAYRHERGRAATYISIGDSGMRKIVSATFTANSFTPNVPTDVNPLRIGMIVDLPGTTYFAGSTATVRYTARLTGWAENGSILYVDEWRRATAGNASVVETPPNGRRVVINPLNKIWATNANVFLSQKDGATYGEVSGSIMEFGFLNDTGKEILDDFDQNTHPLHFTGIDMSMLSSAAQHGGGIAFKARGGAQKWNKGFESNAARTNFHTTAGPRQTGQRGFVTTVDATGGVDVGFLSEIEIGGVLDRNVEISGRNPMITIGRDTINSGPILNFKSASAGGAGKSHDARIFGSGGTGTAGRGVLHFDAAEFRVPLTIARARTEVAQGGFYVDTNEFLKVRMT